MLPLEVEELRRHIRYGLGWRNRLTALGHNLVRGAAGAAVQNAELLVARGVV